MNRTAVLYRVGARDGWDCAYCGRPLHHPHPRPNSRGGGQTPRTLPATVDHRTPRSRGGVNALVNLALACQPCNGLKGDLTEEEFRERGWCAAARVRAQWADAGVGA